MSYVTFLMVSCGKFCLGHQSSKLELLWDGTREAIRISSSSISFFKHKYFVLVIEIHLFKLIFSRTHLLYTNYQKVGPMCHFFITTGRPPSLFSSALHPHSLHPWRNGIDATGHSVPALTNLGQRVAEEQGPRARAATGGGAGMRWPLILATLMWATTRLGGGTKEVNRQICTY